MVGRFPAAELTDEQYRTVVQLNQTSVIEVTRGLLPLLRKGDASGDRQHRVDFGADRRQRRLVDLFGDQGVRLHLFEGAGARAGPGGHPGQLRFARYHHHRVSTSATRRRRKLEATRKTIPDQQARYRRRTARRPTLPRLPMRLPATSPGQVLEVNGGQLIT